MLIQANKIIKRFYSEDIETTALRNVNLTIEKGEFIAIMGPSGCGKSTLLNILGLLELPDSGSYTFDGKEMTVFNEKERTFIRRGKIGFVFQNFNLVDELNVRENVELPLVFTGVSRKERNKRVAEILSKLKMGHRMSYHPQQLSGGQQQRIAFARAVIGSPELILADEPTGNLDSKNGIQVLNLLSEYNRNGTTIIMVTHSPRDASYAHRIIHMHDGLVVVPDEKKLSEIL